jgi:hypothetical protein
MSKKNRDRSGKQQNMPENRGSDESRSSSTQDRAEQVQSRITNSPSDAPHKGKQKRFGHN